MIANIVKEINELLNNGQPYSALGMALALPDICGSVAYPDLSVGERYRQWFDKHVVEPENPIFKDGFIALNGAICYKLRCAYLHSGNFNLGNADEVKDIERFVIHYNRDPLFRFCNTVRSDKSRTMFIDLGVLCSFICRAAITFYMDNQDECVNKTVDIEDVTPSDDEQRRMIASIEKQTGLTLEQIKELKQEDNSLMFDMGEWELPANLYPKK